MYKMLYKLKDSPPHIDLGNKFKNLCLKMCSLFAVLCKQMNFKSRYCQEATQHLIVLLTDSEMKQKKLNSNMFEWKFPTSLSCRLTDLALQAIQMLDVLYRHFL